MKARLFRPFVLYGLPFVSLISLANADGLSEFLKKPIRELGQFNQAPSNPANIFAPRPCNGNGDLLAILQTPATRAVANDVYAQIDQFAPTKNLGTGNQLNAVRKWGSSACFKTSTPFAPPSFAQSISSMIDLQIDPMSPPVEPEIREIYKAAPVPAAMPVGLATHPMCPVTGDSLKALGVHTSGISKWDIDIANQWVTEVNAARNALNRERGLTSSPPQQSFDPFANLLNPERPPATEARKRLDADWGRLFGCLAYIESLGDSDSSTSKNCASNNGLASRANPKNPGVLCYVDSSQSNPASKLNLGLFQFAPSAKGNIRSCIGSWNQMAAKSPACTMSSEQANDTSYLKRKLFEPDQMFNAFCGINKVVEVFDLQVNASAAVVTRGSGRHTQSIRVLHPSNGSGGQIPAPQDRCVTPFIGKSNSYAHFGPLQNSTGANFNKLMTCLKGSLDTPATAY